MSKFILIFSIVFSGLTVNAVEGELDNSAIDFGNKFLLCSAFITDYLVNPSPKIVSGKYENFTNSAGQKVTVTTVELIQEYPEPDLNNIRTTLTIHEKQIKLNNPPPGTPTYKLDLTCHMKKH